MAITRRRRTRPCNICGDRFSTQGLLGLHVGLVHVLTPDHINERDIEDSKLETMSSKRRDIQSYPDMVDKVAIMNVIPPETRREIRTKYDDARKILEEIDQCASEAANSPSVETLIQAYKARLKLEQILETQELASDRQLMDMIGHGDYELVKGLKLVVSRHEGRKSVSKLQGERAQHFIDMAYEVLRPRPTFGPQDITKFGFVKIIKLRKAFRRRLHRSASRLAEETSKLPSGLMIEGVTLLDHFAWAIGSFGEVYLGTLNKQKVAVKRMRICHMQSPEERIKLQKNICREVLMWSLLKHPNVLPLYGISNHLFPTFEVPGIISPFLGHGDVMAYLRGQRNDDALIWRLLTEIVAGLQYLHANNIVHGDLRPPNILIGDDDHVKLSDFGLANFADSTLQSTSDPEAGAQSPERYLDDYRPSKKADVFAVGTVLWEVRDLFPASIIAN